MSQFIHLSSSLSSQFLFEMRTPHLAVSKEENLFSMFSPLTQNTKHNKTMTLLATLLLSTLCFSSEAWIPLPISTRHSSSQLEMAIKKIDPEKISLRKKIIEESAPPDKYHLTTNSKKELIFDKSAGRFFETSIRPGSLHQLWQEFLVQDDENIPTDATTTTTGNAGFSNEMVPTRSLARTTSTKYEADVETYPEECLIHTPYQDTCEPVTFDDSSYDDFSGTIPGSTQDLSPSSPPTIVEECYNAWNSRDMKAVVDCFTSSFEYQDSQFLGTMSTKQELEQHFSRQADLLPANCKIVLDHIACDEENGNIATQWHIVRSDATIVPFTKGVSFYTTQNGRIVSGFRVSEMLVKPSKNYVSGMISRIPSFPRDSNQGGEKTTTNSSASNLSIIEKYFEAWNKRDMESALDCFVEDCVYQTEDPVFVDTLVGKAALREHLINNANVLPPSCKIILDKIAKDEINGNIGTCWHLEVNGLAIPNLRGCSMYTTDPEGLLETGFDVTEAPVKLPRNIMPLLWGPAVALFDLA